MAHRAVKAPQPTMLKIFGLEKTASLKSRRGAKSPCDFTGEASLPGLEVQQRVAVLRLICLIVACC